MVPRALFAGLVDDAALFPPGNAAMDRALAEHATHRTAWYADLVGPFLCPASRIDELLEALVPEQRLDLSLVFDLPGERADGTWRAAAADPRVRLRAVEATHARLGADATAVGSGLKRVLVTGYLEVPRTGFDPALDLVARTGWHAAKYRTGGTAPEAFPTERELAAFLLAVTGRELTFKLTAGLHHAVRGTDPASGFEMHGVLNVLVATRVAMAGGSLAEVAAMLAQKEPGPLVEFVRGWDESVCTDVRRAFRSFGCCGVTDPIGELAALGLLDGARA